MLRLIRDIAKENRITVLLVIHDLNLALRYCDRFFFLKVDLHRRLRQGVAEVFFGSAFHGVTAMLSAKVKQDILAVYGLIAGAESRRYP